MSEPYLSVVATARNDNHGGNLLRRMQTFVNALVAQVKRHRVPTELILVEWNPPEDQPRLPQALRWPEDLGCCTVRIIEVPAELHRRFKHADALPLYQMIAKNVGIRRARGEFVLATNIDILFSEELFELFAAGQLDKSRMYRVDRYDTDTGVPPDATIEERLAYCGTHLLRVNAREGTFNLAPENFHLAAEDIAAQGSGVSFGKGWFAVERFFGVLFRWAQTDAEVNVKLPGGEAGVLAFEIEPGPGVGYKPFRLQVLDPTGASVSEVRVEGRSVLRIWLAARRERSHHLRFRVIGGGLKIPHDPRTLNFRAYRCVWDDAQGLPNVSEDLAVLDCRLVPAWRILASKVRAFCRASAQFVRQLRMGRRPVRIGLPVSPRLLEKLRLHFDGSGLSFVLGARKPPNDSVPSETGSVPSSESDFEPLHTNGCGDFTLLAREHWMNLRGYPEFDLFSMNIDSVFCYAAHHGGASEQYLGDPLRIYHIEHGAGSGWTPEGQAALFERIAAKGLSWIDYKEVMDWARQMHRLGTPMIFNKETWGLAEEELRETVFCGQGARSQEEASHAG